MTTGGRDEVEPVAGLLVAGIMGFEVKLDLLGSVGCQAVAIDDRYGAESGLSITRVLVTGTTVKIWAETPFMMVWMVVGNVTTMEVVDGTPDFPWFSFGPPI